MKVLDCHSIDTTYESLGMIFGIDINRIHEYLTEFDLDSYYVLNPNSHEYVCDVLMNELRAKHNISEDFEGAFWFHLCRVWEDQTFFQEGILPLGCIHDRLLKKIQELVVEFGNPDDQAAFLRGSSDEHHQHLLMLANMKLDSKSQWGPYAMLIRDVAFTPDEMGNHDYLDIPEYVEDICLGLGGQLSFDLVAKYKAATKPCIVKFFSPISKPYYLTTALYFLYRKKHGKKINLHANICFDGKGNKVSKENVVEVEVLT